ncbi:T9SS type A sorting domain-containing protein [Fulvivirgaceae bacterium PWU4]|uniref:T9SS type A sorting domain-containing protein n=2 Tax=Chryseosolibacter histidini TaxID=2782349 RepID=A0AAP2GPE5_9BACT|nr:T9SS type A sorting domain-containing protein [Chryseosolibacter histidini]
MIARSLHFFAAWCISIPLFSQVAVEVDVSGTAHAVSPYLYGRNNSLSDDPSRPLSAAEWQKLKDAGVTFLRESGGNNCTKYNWRRKLSSHPDWYNNVYPHDWDFAATSLQQHLPAAQGMWSFQLAGKAARTSAANFNDWGYNQSKWWDGVNQNLAGGGVPQTSGGSKALQEGDPTQYLENWTPDSTVNILDHWFGTGGIGLDKSKVRYWNMDNEIEIWSGTHDDILPAQPEAEAFMQQYFAVAKKARAAFPAIRLVGPVTANEWQWYNWSNGPVTENGVKYAWLKFFIKRVAEEQQASGVRLLDVLDIHFYPSSTVVSNVVQYHRVFFDKQYVFPEANGVKNVNGNWDNNQNKEYILQRCREWLEQYMGPGHGVTFGVTEVGIPDVGANAIAAWYAGTLGEFMRQPDMEVFSPWHWYPAMWEVLHLFSRYNKTQYVGSTSSEEELVSAYPTINAAGDSVTVALVNRATISKTVNLHLKGFVLADGDFSVLKLANLPSTETFVSHQVNALQKTTVQKNGNGISVSLPAMSVASVQLKGSKGEVVTSLGDERSEKPLLEVYPTPSTSGSSLKVSVNKSGHAEISLLDVNGKLLFTLHKGVIKSAPFVKDVDTSALTKGIYFIRLKLEDQVVVRKVVF